MQFFSLPGLTPYDEASALQRRLVDLRARDEIEDTVLFLEHPAVITRGRGLQFVRLGSGEPRERQMPLPAQLTPGVQFAETERGGDLTYHGPGQLVIYPIFKLDGRGFGPEHDVSGFLRRIEQLLIDELESLHVQGETRENATGVWVKDSEGADRKVASIGIAVRKWVTWHGMAINVVNDLRPFKLISPCGFPPEVMTRLSDLLPEAAIPARNWRSWLERRLAQRFLDSTGVDREAEIISSLPDLQEGSAALFS
jgi:lipoyl(octanoyl) transferase